MWGKSPSCLSQLKDSCFPVVLQTSKCCVPCLQCCSNTPAGGSAAQEIYACTERCASAFAFTDCCMNALTKPECCQRSQNLADLAGSVLGVCCVNPDGGDYGQWTALVNQALDKWRGPFSQRGCLISLQNHRWAALSWYCLGQPLTRTPKHTLVAAGSELNSQQYAL